MEHKNIAGTPQSEEIKSKNMCNIILFISSSKTGKINLWLLDFTDIINPFLKRGQTVA